MAACQPPLVISDWASGDASTRPSDPTADTLPMATLRLSGDTVREVTVIAMFEAVQDSASPMQTPAPSVSAKADFATTLSSRPLA